MFAKPVKIKPYSAVKSSEQRNILQNVQKQFGLDDVTEYKQLLMPKTVQQAKGITANGEKISLYAESQVPLYFVLKGQLIPTVALLQRLPLDLQLQLMPVIYTVPNTIQFLQSGADFMIPGIFGDLPSSPIKIGTPVQIRELDSKALMTVGLALCDLSKVDPNERGRGIQNLNTVGDKLTPSIKFELPAGFAVSDGDDGDDGDDVGDSADEKDKGKETTTTTTSTTTTTNTDDHAEADKLADKVQSTSLEEEYDPLSMDEADSAFEYAVLRTTRLPHTYPMSMAAFAALLNENMPYQHPEMSIKATSFKKMGKLLKHFEKNGRISLRERQGGEVMILEVHVPENEKLKLPEKPKPKPKQQKLNKNDMLQGLLYYKPKPALRELFLESLPEILEASQVKSQVIQYIKSHNLVQSNVVTLDDKLRRGLGQKQTATHLNLQDLAATILNQCTQFHKIVPPKVDPASMKLNKGGIPKIQIKTERRGGNKVVTLIQTAGINGFQLSPPEFAEELRHACAGSSTISDVKGFECIVVQGNHVDKVKKLLNKKGIQNAWMS